MRPIDNRHLRRAANLDVINASNTAIGTVATAGRGDFIKEHQGEWSLLRTGLWAVGCMKCWYSEAALQEGEGHVEHFRPKGRLSGARHAGYWWRAFDWQNFRLAHPTVNLRREDYLTKRKMGKGSYFPLRHPTRRASNATEEINEEPLLLDPVVPSDTLLIYFDEASGAPRPRFKKQDNEWLHKRADESIEYYHLNEGTWNAKRADLMAAVKALCKQLEELAIAQPRDETAYNAKIDKIVTHIGPFSEFSSACLQIVRENGFLEQFFSGAI
jgi:hypothetical protein